MTQVNRKKSPAKQAIKQSVVPAPKGLKQTRPKTPTPASTAPESAVADRTSDGGILQGLRKWNLVLAALHFVQAAAVLLFSTGKSFPVSTGFTAVDPLQTAAQGKTVLTIGYHHLFDINLVFLVAIFFLLSAAAHLSIATWYLRR